MESGTDISCTIHNYNFLLYCAKMIHYHFFYVKVVEDLSGSTLLQTIDRFALNNHCDNVSHQIMSDNIGMYCTCTRSMTL